MSWSLTKIIGLVIIPLMVASAILASLQSINTETIQPSGEDANQGVKNYGRTVTIGNNVQEESKAREQLKGAIIISQASAWNCAMIPAILNGQLHGDGYNLDSSDAVQDDGGSDPEGSDYIVYGRDTGEENRLFMYLWRSKSVPSCTGASEINLPSIDISLPSIGDVVNMVTLIDDYEGIAEFMTCQVKSTMEKQNGHDMEGVYGRIKLDIAMSTKLGNETHNLWAINIKNNDDNCWGRSGSREIQHLWKGKDISEYVPFPNIDSSKKKITEDEIAKIKDLYSKAQGGSAIGQKPNENENYDDNGILSGVGDPGSALAGEVIVDAPLILPNGPDSSASNLPWKVRNGYYLFCKGARGFIQSNTIAPSQEQESTKQTTESLLGSTSESYTGASSVTYTYVVVTKKRKACFDQVEPNINPNARTFTVNGVEIKYYVEETP